jgi:hypothetical protein
MTSGITCSEKTNSVTYNFLEVSNGMRIVIRGTGSTERKTNWKCNISELGGGGGPSVLKFEIIGFFLELMTCLSLSNAHLHRL